MTIDHARLDAIDPDQGIYTELAELRALTCGATGAAASRDGGPNPLCVPPPAHGAAATALSTHDRVWEARSNFNEEASRTTNPGSPHDRPTEATNAHSLM